MYPSRAVRTKWSWPGLDVFVSIVQTMPSSGTAGAALALPGSGIVAAKAAAITMAPIAVRRGRIDRRRRTDG